jgi:hypothetical protein
MEIALVPLFISNPLLQVLISLILMKLVAKRMVSQLVADYFEMLNASSLIQDFHFNLGCNNSHS